MAIADDQHFCLKWNNFQANITSQFETLRYDEDFTDVTIACDGQRLQAHKVVLSACSPFFKELFKTNPCPHPIIFMRDVEAKHITSLIEFMYAGEVNIAQAHLSTFLKTAESLKIRGLTDTTSDLQKEDDTQDTVYSQHSSKHKLNKSPNPNSTVTSSQDVPETLLPPSSPPTKKVCKSETESLSSKQENVAVSVFNLKDITENKNKEFTKTTQPKLELPDYLSDVADDEDGREDNEGLLGLFPTTHIREMSGGMEIIPQSSGFYEKDTKHEQLGHGLKFKRRKSMESWFFNNNDQQMNLYEDSTELPPIVGERQKNERRNRLIKLGEGIEIYEDQLRSVKWNDYRKLTRGLATILFSPAELATCSVTGQRWSRAGNGERPVKPALDRAKVQAIISYVANRFPMVEISRIKQVLAYKCKENSTAFKMKAVRYFGDQMNK
ncbi:uncharacterized protein LOC130894082 isoform X1 [Diorhabda carinulata]|uniref:uncharacterized protein LOC130894082 isoform X1 n=1 Tax=Diorhabda carinulata TaxID=1163345 RepID=UPI0025A155D7|nr:uncharacterized protein LOC130894082 isoform X1 [Diorhabda carinulata]XP_057656638.1 uncharacterized protein LOC130894082 isoform X1 [Diorhabda carinulata]